MTKYLIYYWLSVVAGIVMSMVISSLTHAVLDIPRGVPLANLGKLGTVAQISLTILPFFLAPVITGLAYFGAKKCRPSKQHVISLTTGVGFSVVVISSLYWLVSGAWFGLIQAPPSMIAATLILPPLVAAVLFGALFPTTGAILARRAQ